MTARRVFSIVDNGSTRAVTDPTIALVSSATQSGSMLLAIASRFQQVAPQIPSLLPCDPSILQAHRGLPLQISSLPPVEGPAKRAGRELDDKDLQIIAALQLNGRATYAELAETIALSQAAIRLRVNRLLDSGIVEIVAITDPLTIGFTVVAMIGLTVDGDIEALSEEIGARDYAVYVVLTAGRFDMLVEVLCADNDHLVEVMSDLRGLDGVSSVEAHTYLRLTKQTYAWGIPPDRRERD